jgi:hypothetical protein
LGVATSRYRTTMMMQPPTTSFIKVWGCTVSLLRCFVYEPGPMIIGLGPVAMCGNENVAATSLAKENSPN